MFNPNTPETDACWDSASCNPRLHAQKLERERDEAREENAKLRDIAEGAIDMLEFNAHSNHGTIVQLRAKLNQLKEDAK